MTAAAGVSVFFTSWSVFGQGGAPFDHTRFQSVQQKIAMIDEAERLASIPNPSARDLERKAALQAEIIAVRLALGEAPMTDRERAAREEFYQKLGLQEFPLVPPARTTRIFGGQTDLGFYVPDLSSEDFLKAAAQHRYAEAEAAVRRHLETPQSTNLVKPTPPNHPFDQFLSVMSETLTYGVHRVRTLSPDVEDYVRRQATEMALSELLSTARHDPTVRDALRILAGTYASSSVLDPLIIARIRLSFLSALSATDYARDALYIDPVLEAFLEIDLKKIPDSVVLKDLASLILTTFEFPSGSNFPERLRAQIQEQPQVCQILLGMTKGK